MGTGDRAPSFPVGDQGPRRGLRAARRVRREPPQGPPSGGDHLAAAARVRLRGLFYGRLNYITILHFGHVYKYHKETAKQDRDTDSKDDGAKTKSWINKILTRFPENASIYDYSQVQYINSTTKLTIRCVKCQKDFTQAPNNHYSGQGCPLCHKPKPRTKEAFLDILWKKHPNNRLRYDYQLTNYKKSMQKITIACRKCKQSFKQSPHAHMQGDGCPKCAVEQRRSNIHDFIQKIYKIHPQNKYFYDYSNVTYVTNNKKIAIVCKTCHYEFKQRPYSHMQGNGCPKCANNRRKSNTQQFINKIYETHPQNKQLYDYTKVKYVTNATKVCILCKTCKHEFYQTPNQHLSLNQGCPNCASPKMEKAMLHILKKLNLFFIKEKIIFIPQKTHQHIGKYRKYDFYIPKYHLLIELDGTMHFKDILHFNSTTKKVICNDLFKNALATNSLPKTMQLHPYNVLRIDYKQNVQSMETLLQKTITNIENNQWQGSITFSDLSFYSHFYSKYYKHTKLFE